MPRSHTVQIDAPSRGRRLRKPHLTVRRKLYLSFACVVGLLVAVVGVAFFAMSSLDSAHKRVANTVLPQIVVADTARSAASDMHFSQTRYVLVPSAYKDYLPDRAAFQHDLGAVRRSATSDGKADVKAISTAYAHVQAIDAQLHADVLAGRTTAANAIVTGKGNDASDGLVAALTAYQNHLAATSAQATSSFNATRTSSYWMMGGLGAAAILVALALAYVISRSLVGGIRQMLTAAEGIADGDVDQKVTLHSSDELGETASAFRRMIVYLHGMAGAAERIAAGDLTGTVTPTSERDALGNAFAVMTTNLREIVGQVDAAAMVLAASSQQVASTSEEAGRAVTEIASAIAEIADGAGRQVHMVEQARRSAEET
ncbi:MAG TPA: methyl-accepting chemotaxis protein, partial [Gaiellales bacterium]